MSGYLESAPRQLVKAHRLKKIGKGWDILGRLLTEQQMDKAWKRIAKRTKASGRREAAECFHLWGEIVTTLQRAKRKPASREGERDHFESIASDAKGLADKLREGQLDRKAYAFFPDQDALIAFGEQDWGRQDYTMRQAQVAESSLRGWPSLPEMLDELAVRALDQAESVMKKPRLAERDTRNRAINYFVRGMANYFQITFGGHMATTLASIATAVFQREIPIETVKGALRHHRKRGCNRRK